MAYYQTELADDKKLYWAIDESLKLLSEEFKVSPPRYAFDDDPQYMELFNAVYYPRSETIVFYRGANPDIVSHEFGHFWLSKQRGQFTEAEHERFAVDFAQENSRLIRHIWQQAGLP